MNELQIFNHPEFGELTVLMIDGKEHFAATESAILLKYSNPHDALIRHCRYLVKHEVPHPQNPNKTIEKNFIPEGDLYRLITHSHLPSAQRCESWIFDEVVPSIRKTGSYTVQDLTDSTRIYLQQKRLEVMDRNSKTKQANMLIKLKSTFPDLSPETTEVIAISAVELITDKKINHRPKLESKTYSATDIGAELGVGSTMVGRMANANNLKTEMYGIRVVDKSPYSNKTVENFRYNEAGRQCLYDLFGKQMI